MSKKTNESFVSLHSIYNTMYTKEQASKIRQQFWTNFGQYMKPIPGAAGEKVNWLNYKTGVPNVFFKMNTAIQKATVIIELRQPDTTERLRCYEQFKAMKNLLEKTTGFNWQWDERIEDENGQIISSIGQVMENVNVLNEADWPAIIAFLKPRIISLDAFWEMARDAF